MNKKGLAQIPLMIGLLVMAVAVPVATKLVQQSQDTRNQAAGCTSLTVGLCGVAAGCPVGKKCIYTTYGYSCAGTCASPTPTSTPRPPTPTPNPCSVTSNKPLNCPCSYNNQCASGNCSGVCVKAPTPTSNPNACNSVYETRKCVNSAEYTCTNNVWVKTKTCSGPCVHNACPQPPTPTLTPRPPTPTPNPNACNSVYETRKCVNSAEYTCTNNVWVKTKTCSGPCVHNACPTPTTCLKLGDPCTTESCCSGLKCSGGGYGAFECIPDTTISPPATAIPTLSGCSANKLYQCGSLGGCGVGYRCMLSGSYYCKYDSSCPGGPTNTPTATPTEKPTATPTSSGPLKCYCVDNCANDECNWQSAPGGGYNRYCTSDSCRYVPTPRQPTNTPTPTLQCNKNTVGKCGAAGGCKLGEMCKTYDNISYVCRIDDSCKQLPPTNTPTATPTRGPNPPTSGPIPTTGGCSGSKPADKCTDPKTLYIDAQCVDNRWDWNEQLCNSAGKTESCGGKNYCCLSAGGVWATDMSKCPTTCTQCVGKPEAKSKGDADCSGVTDLNDFSIWRSEFITGALGVTVKNSWRADFDCNGKVNLNDFSIWRDNFIKSL